MRVVTPSLQKKRQELNSTNEELRYNALRSIDADVCESLFEDCVRCLGDASWRVRKAAVTALANCTDTLMLWSVIRKSLESSDNAGLRSAAAELLQRHRQGLESQIIQLAESGSASLRKLALDALGQQAPDQSIVPMLLQRLGDSDANVRAAAVEALGRSSDSRAKNALREIVGEPLKHDALVQVAALRGLTESGAILSLDELQGLMQRPLLRDNAVALLGRSPEPESIELLVELITTGKPATLREALVALNQRWNDYPSERKTIAKWLGQMTLRASLLHGFVCNSVRQELLQAVLNMTALAANKQLFSELFLCMQHFNNPMGLAEALELLGDAGQSDFARGVEAMSPAQQHVVVSALETRLVSRSRQTDNNTQILNSLLVILPHCVGSATDLVVTLLGEHADPSSIEPILKLFAHRHLHQPLCAVFEQLQKRLGDVVRDKLRSAQEDNTVPCLTGLLQGPVPSLQSLSHPLPRARMSLQEFSQIGAILATYAGFAFASSSIERVERRVRKRMLATEITDYPNYIAVISGHDQAGIEERQALVETLTVHETYFFREPRQLRAIEQEVLPDLISLRAQEQRLRIWSAGCSSGEEPYTLAMLLQQRHALKLWDLHIVGTDISHKVLRKARDGCYPANSFRAEELIDRSRFFTARGERKCVNDSVKRLVTFRQENLIEAAQRDQPEQVFDLILCRNVFIYFDRSVQQRLAALFWRSLRPGGYLLLGHAESLLGSSTDFNVVTLRDDLVYQRPINPEEPS